MRIIVWGNVFKETVQKYFWNKYENEMKSHPLTTIDTGYWTGYLRESVPEAVNGESFEDDFFDSYSNEKLPADFFRKGQPDNKRCEQSLEIIRN